MKETLSPADRRSETAFESLPPHSGRQRGNGMVGLSELLSYCGLTVLVLLFFFRTVFMGLPISKICRLAEWDSIYSAYATGKSALCDPSIVHLLVPHYFLVARIWNQGHLPLWNPYSACGAPLVGDIQATIFSPIRLFFNLCPTMYMYNLSMVLTVVGAIVFTFALCRQLGISRSGSALAAIAYALCPYQLFYLELLSGQSYSLFPLNFWLFVRAAQRRTWTSFAMCGFSAALLIISGHPELSFFGIFFASLLAGFLIVSGATSRYVVVESVEKRLSTFVSGLSIAGLFAFALSAPVLLPFAEYLLNSDCYKFNVDVSGFVPWQCLAYHLLQPGFNQASPYLGIVTTCLWPLALFLKGKNGLVAKCLFAIACVAFVLMSHIGPVDSLFRHPPFLWLVTVYCLPFYLLALAVMSALSLDTLIADSGNKFGLNKKLVLVVLCLLVSLAVPLALNAANVGLSGGDFDLILPHMAFNKTNWWHDCLLGLALILTLIAGNKLKTRYKEVVPAVVLVLAFVGIASLAKTSLPIESKFAFPVVQPLPFLEDSGERMLSVGPHLLRANANTVYGVSSFADFNVLFPKRYLQFAKASGAKVELFTEVFDSSIGRFADMASIKYVLSQVPLRRTNDESFDSFALINEQPGTYRLFENKESLGQAYIVHNFKLVDSDSAALESIASPDYDYKHKVVLESTPQIQMPEEVDGDTDRVVVDRPNPNSVVINATSAASGILVLTDTYYPGWKAFLDGREVPILRANYLFRGIELPQGSHQVRFTYEPFSFWLGVALAVAALLIGLLACLPRKEV